jgi:hypothetical protein
MKLPNNIDLEKLGPLLMYSERYEINIQFWPEQFAIFIAKDGVDLENWGGDFDDIVEQAIEYLERINKPQKEKLTIEAYVNQLFEYLTRPSLQQTKDWKVGIECWMTGKFTKEFIGHLKTHKQVDIYIPKHIGIPDTMKIFSPTRE